MMAREEPLPCPFCPFAETDEHFLIQHVETVHPENGESPFICKDTPRQELLDQAGSITAGQGKSDDDYIECFCGEFCLSSDFDRHLELHNAEGTGFDETERTSPDPSTQGTVSQRKAHFPETHKSPSILRQKAHASRGISLLVRSPMDKDKSYVSPSSGHDESTSVGEVIAKPMRLTASTSPSRNSHHARRRRDPQRLGKAELGPHADERQMPGWLRKILEQGAKVTVSNQIDRNGRLVKIESVANEIRGIMPVINQLCCQDTEVSQAYLCHPCVTYIVKMTKEGGFCGYRNIQMIISNIQDTKFEGYEHFPGKIPSILHLQDMIENAWDMGFNPLGRIETGGVKGTRKYIGTPEAQALLESLKIKCAADAFNRFSKTPPHQQLLQAVEEYFLRGTTDFSRKVCKTSLPPIYFQHPGHSLTIVGFERRKSGACNLLVFDPMFRPSPGIHRLIGTRFKTSNPEDLLRAYRRGESHLGEYSTFEILMLTSRPPRCMGWYE